MGGTVKIERFDYEEENLPSRSGERRALEIATPEAFVPLPPEARRSIPAPEESVAPRETNPEALRTRLARKFTTIADLVSEGFAEFRIGAGSWGVELTAPEGMSTAGGKQRLQHLRLRPRRPGFPVLVGGTVDAEKRTAMLRDFDYLFIVHALRFKKDVEVTPSEWEQFLRKAEVELRNHDIHAVRLAPPKDLVQQYTLTRPVSRPMIAVFAAVTVMCAIVLWRVIVALAR